MSISKIDGATDFERLVTTTSKRPINFSELLVAINGCIPLAILIYDARHHQLGPNPISNALHTTGMISLLFLIATLAITPLRVSTGWSWLFHFRRPLGLFAFLYACAHMAIFIGYDRNWILSEAWSEVLKRRYLQVGLLAVLLMVPLAVTSTPFMVWLLGFKRWKWLHRLVYISVVASVVHFYMQVKVDVRLPISAGVVVGGLLLFRVVKAIAWSRVRFVKTAIPEEDDHSLRTYRIHFAESNQDATVGPETTVLEAAESIGIPLPFECRSGLCGTCKTQLIDGRVRMEIDEILNDADKANSIILACQAVCRTDVSVRA